MKHYSNVINNVMTSFDKIVAGQTELDQLRKKEIKIEITASWNQLNA